MLFPLAHGGRLAELDRHTVNGSQSADAAASNRCVAGHSRQTQEQPNMVHAVAGTLRTAASPCRMQTSGLGLGVSHSQSLNGFGLYTRQERGPAQHALFPAVFAIEFIEILHKRLTLRRRKRGSLPWLARDRIFRRRMTDNRVTREKAEAILADIRFIVQTAPIDRIGHGCQNGTVSPGTRCNPRRNARGSRCHGSYRARVARINHHDRNALFSGLGHDERQMRRRCLRVGTPNDDELGIEHVN